MKSERCTRLKEDVDKNVPLMANRTQVIIANNAGVGSQSGASQYLPIKIVKQCTK